MDNNKRKEKSNQEKVAVEFVKDLNEKFSKPIIDSIDRYLDEQDYDEKSRVEFRKVLLVSIGNSILLSSGLTKKELKESFKGMIADYNKIK